MEYIAQIMVLMLLILSGLMILIILFALTFDIVKDVIMDYKILKQKFK